MRRLLCVLWLMVPSEASAQLQLAVNQDASISLGWIANAPEETITGYRVYVGTQSKQYTVVVNVGVVTTWTFDKGQAGTPYYFSVSATNDYGESPLMDEVMGVYGAPAPQPTPTLVSLTLSPKVVTGGQSTVGTVSVSAPALEGGVVVTLFRPGWAAWFVTIPDTVTVPSGNTFATFPVTTTPVPTDQGAIVTAQLGTVSLDATFQVMAVTTPPPAEVCGDKIDNNSNGQIDEDCAVDEGHAPMQASLEQILQMLLHPTAICTINGISTPYRNSTDQQLTIRCKAGEWIVGPVQIVKP
jgi:hypothetical protein